MSIFSDQTGKKMLAYINKCKRLAKEQSVSKVIKPNTIKKFIIGYYYIKIINNKIDQIEKREKTKHNLWLLIIKNN